MDALKQPERLTESDANTPKHVFAYVIDTYIYIFCTVCQRFVPPKPQVVLLNKQRKDWITDAPALPNEANSLSCNGCPVSLIPFDQTLTYHKTEVTVQEVFQMLSYLFHAVKMLGSWQICALLRTMQQTVEIVESRSCLQRHHAVEAGLHHHTPRTSCVIRVIA